MTSSKIHCSFVVAGSWLEVSTPCELGLQHETNINRSRTRCWLLFYPLWWKCEMFRDPAGGSNPHLSCCIVSQLPCLPTAKRGVFIFIALMRAYFFSRFTRSWHSRRRFWWLEKQSSRGGESFRDTLNALTMSWTASKLMFEIFSF